MIGRALLRFPVRSRLLRRSTPSQCHQATRAPVILSTRSYATPGRPKSVVGEPSRPVKRAVKKAAAKPATGDSAAEKKIASKTRNTSSKKDKKVKKALSPEELAAKKEKELAKKARAKVAAEKQKYVNLKKAALDPPNDPKAPSAWNAYVTQHMKDRVDQVLSTQEGEKDHKKALTEASRSLSTEYRSLSAGEVEHYNHLARTKQEAGSAEFKRWVESHTPDEIHAANNARAQLRRRLKKENPDTRTTKWARIHDEREVKRPNSPFIQFSLNRHASGDFKGIPVRERAKLIAQEWKALSEQEKKKYDTIFSRDHDRYVSEYEETYGHPPSIVDEGARLQAATAAA